MKVAPQHPECERVGAGERVEERLLLGGVALQRGHIAGGRVERAVPVEADFADAASPRFDQAAVAAGETPHHPAPHPIRFGHALDQLALADSGVERLG